MDEEISIDEDLHGKWVILLDENIIAYGKDIKELIEEAKAKHPNKKFVLAQIPEKGNLIY